MEVSRRGRRLPGPAVAAGRAGAEGLAGPSARPREQRPLPPAGQDHGQGPGEDGAGWCHPGKRGGAGLSALTERRGPELLYLSCYPFHVAAQDSKQKT